MKDQGGDQPHAVLVGQDVERRLDLGVLGAVEGREERLQRAEVQGRQVGRRLDRPFSQGHPEEVQVMALQVGRPGDPDEAERRRGRGQHRVSAVEHHLGEDQQGGEGLPAALTEEIDEGLGPRPRRIGERHEEQLAARAVDRVAEGAVGPLEQERRAQPSAQSDPGRAHEEQDGQHPERAVKAEHAEQPVGQQELGDEGQQVQHHVDGGEELAELRRRYVLGDRALEHVVAEGEGDGRDEDQPGQAAHVRLAPQKVGGLDHGEGTAGGGRSGGRAPGPAQGQRGTESGQGHGRGGGKHQYRRRRAAGKEAGEPGARHRSQQAPGPDEAVDALGLGHRVHVPQDQPELQHRQAPDEAGPDVERVQTRRAAPRPGQPEDEGRGGEGEEQDGQAECTRPAARPGHLGEAHRHPGDDQVDPRQAGRGKAREEKRVASRLE